MPMDVPSPPSSAYVELGKGLEFTRPKFLVIGNKLVTINMDDGALTFGPAYKPDEAAKIFWQSLVGDYKEYLEWKSIHSK